MWRMAIACLSLLAAGPTQAQELIRLARIADIPDQYVGGEMLRAVYAKLNIRLEFEDVPGKRALALSSAGEVDGEIQRIGTLSRDYPTLIQVTPAINYIEPTVFTTKLRFDVAGWNSIRDYNIGIVRGVGSSEAGTRDMARVTATTSLENMIQMLDADRFDVMVTDLFSGLVAVRKLNLQARIYPLSPPLERIHIYHYLHERHRDLVPKVGKVIAQMEASGELAALREALVKQVLSAP
ncbi:MULTISPECIES: substrate-binding periplasmic protein [Bradyrhizobium]|uniref:ABC transporter substrate-binding protein n=1 Tax=Bradyrhizobium diazoefficiens TaxID=1355477 RepID=A0A809YMW9_9BRAD|nr:MULTISPECIES: transporter substrate-binding domain-containing protein [Bradyrhizobium]MBP1064337.1 ABC-type amino acid transport substrate-binding protein [Bradyrhizobium japonicum]AWO92308.2 transporter substrate-binding domain-containing protein [Bradyrhizobium diazoefficiens]MDA9389962.1 ABC transporter substrate-binding protein [Bradyrhizobium sp. CCBAU 45394]WLA77329.1 transporter substrate-binding domain-containing protein [Bradyrhizobium diazoefficiens]BCA05268.1 ABC transporter subs